MNTLASSQTNFHPQTTLHQSHSRWVRWLTVLLLVIIGLPLAGFSYQTVAAGKDLLDYPMSGEQIDVGGYRLHLYCEGTGSPTVILDALQPGTVANWAWIQPEIARTTRVCAYDRAGLGWSDAAPASYDARQNTYDLHTLLQNAGIEPPYVMVGHSLGGLYSRVYASQYPQEVVGMVLLDATHPDSWQRLGLAEGIGMDKDMLAMGPLVAHFGLTRLINFAPVDPDLPAHQQAELRAYYATSKFAENARDIDAAFPQILAQGRAVQSLGSLPLIVLTTGTVDSAATEKDNLLREMQLELAGLSSRGLYRAIEGATHVSLVHHPGHALAAIQAIEDILTTVRPLMSFQSRQFE